jgi:probable HAF family extracellular repeat protein
VAGIDSAGEVAFTSGFGTVDIHSYLYSGGTSISIDPVGSLGSEVMGMNATGQIIGEAETTSRIQAFVYSNGSDTYIAPPGSIASIAGQINSAGQATGQYLGSDNIWHAFLYSAGNSINIDPVGYADSNSNSNISPVALNASGQVVIEAVNPNDQTFHGFLFSGGTDISIDPAGAYQTYPFAINAAGQVIGEYTDVGGMSHAFLYNGVTSTTIEPVGRSPVKCMRSIQLDKWLAATGMAAIGMRSFTPMELSSIWHPPTRWIVLPP